MTIFFAVLSFVLFALLIVALYFLLRSAKIILNITDEISDCLDILDASYARIGEILKTPVMIDDPFVRNVIEEIRKSQRAVLVVANKLTASWDIDQDQDEDEDE